jgi:hypothetical protein
MIDAFGYRRTPEFATAEVKQGNTWLLMKNFSDVGFVFGEVINGVHTEGGYRCALVNTLPPSSD